MARNTIFDYQPAWPVRFAELAGGVRLVVGDDALRIDHIGSTSVPGLASKDVVDLQVTVADLHVADAWPDHLATFDRWPGYAADHLPPGAPENDADWAKRYWSRSQPNRAHLHVREAGRPNQRYASAVPRLPPRSSEQRYRVRAREAPARRAVPRRRRVVQRAEGPGVRRHHGVSGAVGRAERVGAWPVGRVS